MDEQVEEEEKNNMEPMNFMDLQLGQNISGWDLGNQFHDKEEMTDDESKHEGNLSLVNVSPIKKKKKNPFINKSPMNLSLISGHFSQLTST